MVSINERKLIGMLNKKFPDWETVFGGILLSLMIFGFSLLSYRLWEFIFQELIMELSKETKMKLWATTDAISDGQTKKKVSRAKDQLLERK